MKRPKMFIALLRIALGWVFLYQGIIAITTPDWTIADKIKDAKTFSAFYALIGQSPNLEYVMYAIKGLFILVGILLILGTLVRFAAFLGALVTLFFYFPLLAFPHVGASYYIVDEHIIIVIILMYLFTVRSGEFFGLGSMFKPSRY